jgi:hypothetical protein
MDEYGCDNSYNFISCCGVSRVLCVRPPRRFIAYAYFSLVVSIPWYIRFGNNSKVSKVYGLFLLPISIAFVGYALFLFVQRAGMIRRRDPGPCK